jgi:hypothetical protein
MTMKTASHVRANVTADGVVLLDVEKGSIYSSNVVGARIWQLIQEGCSEAEVVSRIVDEFGAPRSTVQADVSEFIASLRERALVTAVPNA